MTIFILPGKNRGKERSAPVCSAQLEMPKDWFFKARDATEHFIHQNTANCSTAPAHTGVSTNHIQSPKHEEEYKSILGRGSLSSYYESSSARQHFSALIMNKKVSFIPQFYFTVQFLPELESKFQPLI